MKQKLLALLMVSVMVASTFGAMGISATKVGAAGETLTLSSTSYFPTVGELFTLSGRLTDSSGNPLVNKSIDIFSSGYWVGLLKPANTGTDGKYSCGVIVVPYSGSGSWSTKTITYQSRYKVNGVYVASSNTVTVIVSPPTLTLTSSNYHPAPGESYTLSGRLTDTSGNPLVNKSIDISYRLLSGSWQFSKTVYTGSDGTYSTTTSSTQTVTFQAGYEVRGVYVASSSVNVAVGGVPTQLNATAAPTTVVINQQFTVSGTLNTTGNAPVAGATVQLQKNVSGVWTDVPGKTATTGVNGAYVITVSESAAGQYVYRTTFAGATIRGTTYAASTSPETSPVSVTATPTPTPTPTPTVTPTVTPTAKPTVKPSPFGPTFPCNVPCPAVACADVCGAYAPVASCGAHTATASPASFLTLPSSAPLSPIPGVPEFPLAMAGAGVVAVALAGIYAVMRRRL